MRKFFTMAMGIMVMTGCGDDQRVEPQPKPKQASAVEVKRAETARLKAETQRLKAQAAREKSRAQADRERRKLLEQHPPTTATPASSATKGHNAQTIAHTNGGKVQVTIPKGWQAAPERFTKCVELRTQKKTIICRVENTRQFYDACILNPKRSRTVYVGGVRILGDEEEYVHLDISSFKEQLLELLPRATGNQNISCWSVPLKRVLRGRSYYAHRYRRRRGKRHHHRRDNGDLASKKWVRERFASKASVQKNRRDIKKNTRRVEQLGKLFETNKQELRKIRRHLQPRNIPQS